MKEIISGVSKNGRVTIPVDVRRHLELGTPGNVAFVVEDDGTVTLRPARFMLESVLGSIEALPGESADLEQEIEEATQAEADRIMQRMEGP